MEKDPTREIKNTSIDVLVTVWRRKRDLNPRTLLHVYELSKPAPSASWVLLRKLTSILDVRIVLYQKINNNHYLFYKCFFLE